MPSHTDLGPAPRPPDLQPLLSQISAARAAPDDDSLTADSILSSIAFLSTLSPEIHWLCNSSPLLPVVAQAVQIWGYGEPVAQQTLSAFKPVLTAALGRCAGCGMEWQRALRRELNQAFSTYSYDESSTAEFFAELENWDVERLGGALTNGREFVAKIPMGWKHVEVWGPVVECLAQPRLLLRPDVYSKWKGLVLGFERVPRELSEEWLPGAVVLIFDWDERIVDIGENMFKRREAKISSSDFETEIFKPLSALVANLSHQVRKSSHHKLTSDKRRQHRGCKYILERNQHPTSVLPNFRHAKQPGLSAHRHPQAPPISPLNVRTTFPLHVNSTIPLPPMPLYATMATHNHNPPQSHRVNLLQPELRRHPPTSRTHQNLPPIRLATRLYGLPHQRKNPHHLENPRFLL